MVKKFIFLLSCLMVFMPVRTYAAEPFGKVYCRSSRETKQIALTFDDGPHPRYTEEILNILSEYNVKATFFIIGVNAENYPDDLKKIYESGCEIGNHTYSHARLDNISPEHIKSEIDKCENVIYTVTGKHTSVLRPPHGFVSENFAKVTSTMGYDVVLWSIDTRDWSLTPSNTIYTTVMKNLKGGDIILMHDYVSGGNTTCDALRKIIPELLSQGYEFVTISELIAR